MPLNSLKPMVIIAVCMLLLLALFKMQSSNLRGQVQENCRVELLSAIGPGDPDPDTGCNEVVNMACGDGTVTWSGTGSCIHHWYGIAEQGTPDCSIACSDCESTQWGDLPEGVSLPPPDEAVRAVVVLIGVVTESSEVDEPLDRKSVV